MHWYCPIIARLLKYMMIASSSPNTIDIGFYINITCALYIFDTMLPPLCVDACKLWIRDGSTLSVPITVLGVLLFACAGSCVCEVVSPHEFVDSDRKRCFYAHEVRRENTSPTTSTKSTTYMISAFMRQNDCETTYFSLFWAIIVWKYGYNVRTLCSQGRLALERTWRRLLWGLVQNFRMYGSAEHALGFCSVVDN